MKRILLLSLCTFLCYICDAQNTVNINWKDSISKAIAKSNHTDTNSSGIFISPIMVQQQSGNCCTPKKSATKSYNRNIGINIEANLTLDWIKQYKLEIEAEIGAKAKEFEDSVNNKKEILDVYDKYLTFRENNIDRWLTVLGILFTFFGIVTPIAGFYLRYRLVSSIDKQQEELNNDFKRMKDEVKNKISEAELLMEKLRKYKTEGKGYRDELKAIKEFATNTDNNKSIFLSDVIHKAHDIANNNDVPLFEKYMARLYEKYLSDKFSEAIEIGLSMIDIFSDSMSDINISDVYFIVGHSYQQQDKYNQKNQEKALEYYNKTISINPDNAIAYNNRAIIHGINKNFDLALKDYNKAITLDPEDSEAYCNRASIHSAMLNYDLAIRDFMKSMEKNSNDDNDDILYTNLAEVYLFTNQIESAKNYINKIDVTKLKDPLPFNIIYTLIKIISNENINIENAADTIIRLIDSHSEFWSFAQINEWLNSTNSSYLLKEQRDRILEYIRLIEDKKPELF